MNVTCKVSIASFRWIYICSIVPYLAEHHCMLFHQQSCI